MMIAAFMFRKKKTDAHMQNVLFAFGKDGKRFAVVGRKQRDQKKCFVHLRQPGQRNHSRI